MSVDVQARQAKAWRMPTPSEMAIHRSAHIQPTALAISVPIDEPVIPPMRAPSPARSVLDARVIPATCNRALVRPAARSNIPYSATRCAVTSVKIWNGRTPPANSRPKMSTMSSGASRITATASGTTTSDMFDVSCSHSCRAR